jgi:hypothetical protein
MMVMVLAVAPLTINLPQFIALDYQNSAARCFTPKILIWFVFVLAFAWCDRCWLAATPKKKGDSLRSRPFACRNIHTPGGV